MILFKMWHKQRSKARKSSPIDKRWKCNYKTYRFWFRQRSLARSSHSLVTLISLFQISVWVLRVEFNKDDFNFCFFVCSKMTATRLTMWHLKYLVRSATISRVISGRWVLSCIYCAVAIRLSTVLTDSRSHRAWSDAFELASTRFPMPNGRVFPRKPKI